MFLFHEMRYQAVDGDMKFVCLCVLSEKRVGNVYSKATSFVDYVRRALRRLELDDSKVKKLDYFVKSGV